MCFCISSPGYMTLPVLSFSFYGQSPPLFFFFFQLHSCHVYPLSHPTQTDTHTHVDTHTCDAAVSHPIQIADRRGARVVKVYLLSIPNNSFHTLFCKTSKQ